MAPQLLCAIFRSVSTPPSGLGSYQFSLSLSLGCQMDKQHQAFAFYLIQYHSVGLVVFNNVVCLYFEVPHSSLLLVDSYTDCGSWF